MSKASKLLRQYKATALVLNHGRSTITHEHDKGCPAIKETRDEEGKLIEVDYSLARCDCEPRTVVKGDIEN